MVTISWLLVPTAIQEAPPPTPPPPLPLPPPAHTGARLLHNLDLLPVGIVSSGRIRGFPAAVRNQASPDGADPPRKPVARGREDHPLHSGRVWGITHTGRSPTERCAQQDLVVSDEDHPSGDLSQGAPSMRRTREAGAVLLGVKTNFSFEQHHLLLRKTTKIRMQMCTVLAFLDPPASMLEFKKSAARDGMDGCPTDPKSIETKRPRLLKIVMAELPEALITKFA
ncbi:uncharacterized protein BO88DRAFT_430376 [Aspergillus vadensis CBS 113365]|uniref:Uncharacterized protein n=1 Tax=Aspergillus vadensis (strain CBS 113365 / IMI 142717 / IBT 24658) TaxID=1448311 RepID=A0A319ATB4_ASPVC|nr:hypothetical protein BO88DRAFT_430376 [Aspergillus vadensis CBS 113365]PYH63577.1 hypothetical protein BO88DRAFT_430376 [Aspergillus vadensis CBS 113365]